MTITAKCKVEMGNIRLPRNINIPDGTQVIIKIHPIEPIAKLKIRCQLTLLKLQS